MTGIDSWSTTPATNATADGGAINWAEGQPPSSVNNTARQMLADERSRQNDLIWFQYGTGDQGAGNLAVPSVYLSSTSFTITGADVTTVYHANRRVRAVGSSTGTIYGSIASSSYNGGNTKTTVLMTWDSGSLSNETLVISLSQVPVTGSPVPTNAGQTTGSWTPVDASGAALTFTSVSANYTKIGNMVFAYGTVTYPVTVDGTAAVIGGLPFSIANQPYGYAPATLNIAKSGNFQIVGLANTVTAAIIDAAANTSAINSQLSSAIVRFTIAYPVA